jgi:16S rRNA (cytidine1402-2'-O)-methyltransferase
MSGTLYIVATPIGNLEDITLRALRILKEADLIACEDTRHTKILLTHYQIARPLVSYHQHSRLQKVDELLAELQSGKSVALVSDAGTPGISDPGGVLVEKAQAAGLAVVPVPGASAVTALASVAGIAMDRFLFLGFLPHKKGRETLLKKITESEVPVIFYESPHRILKTLGSLAQSQGKLIVGRELTKKFEEIFRGSPSEALEHFSKAEARGEFVLIYSNK